MLNEKNKVKQRIEIKPLELHTDRLKILHEIDLAILEARSLDAVSKIVLENINQLIPACEWTSVALFDTETQEATILAARSDEFSTFRKNEHLPLQSFGIKYDTFQQTNTYIVDDLHDLDNPTLIEKELIKHNMRSYMSIPLIARSEIIGSFNLSSSQKRIYRGECVAIAHEISNSLAIAIENIRLIEAEQSRSQELLAMTLVSAALRMAKTHAQISPIVLDQLLTLFKASSALLSKYDISAHEVKIELGLGYWVKATGERLSETEGIFGKVISTKRPYISNNSLNNSLPHFMGKVSSVAFVPLIAHGKAIGIIGIGRQIAITEDEVRLLIAIADMVANTIQSVTLTDDLQRSNAELARAYDSTLDGWARALELRDHETKGHTERVTALTMKLAHSMGITGEALIHLRRGAVLHDIGKIGVPDSILLKPGPLTDDEWVVIRQHPSFAYDMLSSIDFLQDSLDIPYCHHEKWDGSGYPRQLAGEQIPLSARIFAIVDVWDALTSSGRPYRKPLSKEKALEYIQSQRATHFDPQVVDAFMRIVK